MHAGLATFEQALNATIRHGSIATLDDVMYLLVFARDSSAEDACIHGQFSLKSSAPKGMIGLAYVASALISILGQMRCLLSWLSMAAHCQYELVCYLIHAHND